MKFTANAGALASAAQAASEGLARKADTIPILGYIRLEVQGGTLRMTATNLDEQITVPIDVDNAAEGAVCVPGKQFAKTIAAMDKDNRVELVLDGNAIVARSGRSRLRLPVLPVTDFPDMRPGEGRIAFALSFDHLVGTLATVAFAICDDEVRYYLNGVLWSVEGNELWSVATNGHQLAALKIPLPEGGKGLPDIILPKGLVRRLVRMSGKGDAQVAVTDRAILLTLPDGTEMISKLVDGCFPDWRRVVPKAADPVMASNAKLLSDAAARVATVSNEKSHGVRLEVEKGQLRISARIAEVGAEMVEEMPIDFDGAPITLGFNAAYLRSQLAVSHEDVVRFHLTGPRNPILIDTGNANARFVLMPMNS